MDNSVVSGNTTVVDAVSVPTVRIFSCGGAGQNIGRLVLPSVQGRASYKAIDTSLSDTRSEHGEEIHLIGNGSGSGKNRKTNYDAIVRAIPAMTDDELDLADINVVIFALAGGNGLMH